MNPPDGAAGGRGVGTGTHQDLGVTVQRDLTGSGRLARGGETRFSSLRLRSVGRAAPPEAAEGAAAPSPAAPEEAEAAEPEPPAAPAPSALRRLLRWLGLG